MTQKNNNKKYDLEERTAKFGEDIILFCKKVPRGPITDPLITSRELGIKAGTSVGVPINRDEADDAESKKDFRHKIGIVKKESRKTKHFIRMIAIAVPELKSESQQLWKEAKELNLIFNSIYRKVT